MPFKVGIVSSLQGDAAIKTVDGKINSLALGQSINEGDVVWTQNPNDVVGIKTLDQHVIEIPGNTTKVFEQKIDLSAEAQVQQIREDILNNDEFDFNQLEAAAAGESTDSQFIASDATPNNIALNDSDFSSLSPTAQAELDLSSIKQAIGATPSPQAQAIEPSSNVTPQDGHHSLINFDDSSILAFEDTPSTPGTVQLQAISATEDYSLILEGNTGGSDSFVDASIATEFGTVSVNREGEWLYSLNNDAIEIQSLGAGDTLTDNITLISQQGTSYQMMVTINGTNDSPTLSGDRSGHATDNGDSDAISIASGKLTIEDDDAGEARFHTLRDSDTNFGTVNLDALGNWQYQLNNELDAIKGLGNGDNLVDTFSATTSDGTSQLIRINIEGTNDSPIFGGSNQADLELDNAIQANGQLGIDDADFGESKFQIATDIDGQYGSGSIDANGNWSYNVDTLHSKITGLASGETLYDQFVVFSADGTQQGVIVTINGSDTPLFAQADAPTISSQSASQAFDSEQILEPSPDLYIWRADDTHNTETIDGFSLGPNGDTLVLNDLLIDQADTGNLDQYLHFSVNEQGTTIAISPEGQGSEETHYLVLNDLNLGSYGNSDGEIISQLLNTGNLDIAGL